MTHQEIEQKELVDAYVRGDLSEEERFAFEEHFFACDDCFAQVRTAQKFQEGVRAAAESGVLPAAPAPSTTAPLFGWLKPAFAFSAAAAVVMAGVVAWLTLVELPVMRREFDEQRKLAAQQRERGAQLEKQLLAMNQTPAGASNLPLVMLEASRASTTNFVTVPQNAKQVAMWIEVSPSWRFKTFRLEVRTSANHPVDSVAGLTPNSYGALAASFPAEPLRSGAYKARLWGTDGAQASLVAEYPLEVRR